MKLEARQLACTFDKKTVIDGLDLCVNPGEFIVISGASGSGKSTLLRLLNQLDSRTSGELLVDGRSVDDFDIHALRRRIVYLQQQPCMLAASVRDNLQLPFEFAIAQNSAPPDEALRQALDELRLTDVDLDQPAGQLSVGQQQRVALIRAILVEPEVLLCDEPTASLDRDSKAIVEGQLTRQAAEGKAVVLVTHSDVSHEKARRLELINGKLINLTENASL